MKAPSMLNKVPAVTLGFWIIKILSTTVGETGADFLAVNAELGQALTTTLMALALAVMLAVQMKARRYVPWIYWLTVVFVSIVGTQLTDLLTDGLGVSLFLSSAVFALTLAAIFLGWRWHEGTLSIRHIDTRSREIFYWAAILCTFALGTAVGDLATEALGLGFQRGIALFGGLIAFFTIVGLAGVDSVLCFWGAYILTRPLGAALGDYLTQAPAYGGLGLGALRTSALFLAVIAILVGAAQRVAGRSPASA
ncbi:hypothetical protein SNE35_05555 [Paucibacter sp. R3-3]|uniref:Membrane-anchored protein n=1 Tax=Roseateles agri TaxID=3098619 RepID=A0ABU5DDZ2_9BURK|nr:hypothetical protein [Paucibacter sp. R3-3]MDY0743958.1 hypothetical protein [Paucibacter sp. R3-3]